MQKGQPQNLNGLAGQALFGAGVVRWAGRCAPSLAHLHSPCVEQMYADPGESGLVTGTVVRVPVKKWKP
jgi:hypothetical protein